MAVHPPTNFDGPQSRDVRKFLVAPASSKVHKGSASMNTNLRIKDLPDNERPRERLAALGADALSNAEHIAILLRTGMKGMSAIDIAQALLAKHGRLENLARAPLDDLRIKGIGRDKAVALK